MNKEKIELTYANQYIKNLEEELQKCKEENKVEYITIDNNKEQLSRIETLITLVLIFTIIILVKLY